MKNDLFNDKCGSVSVYYDSLTSYLPISNDEDKEWDVNNMNIYFIIQKSYLKRFFKKVSKKENRNDVSKTTPKIF